MAVVIGVISQKGGVGKSTLSRLIAAEYAANEWAVKICDMDLSQGTSSRWNQRRLTAEFQPEISVEQFSRVRQALRHQSSFDLLVFDGAPHATVQTLEIAKASDLVVLPSGIALDDLEPTVRLAHELKENGIDQERIALGFCRVGNSEAELAEAVAYVEETGYSLLKGHLPERTGYRRASDMGRAATETTHKTLNQKADEVVQAVVDRLQEITNG